MLAALYMLPDWLIVVVFLAFAIAAAFTLRRLVHAVVPFGDETRAFDLVMRILPTILTLTAFVLVFVIVQAQAQFGRAEGIVINEATAIEHLDRALERLNPETTAPARRALYAYAVSLVQEEWPYMQGGGNGLGHPQTQKSFEAFEQIYAVMTPAQGRDMALFNDIIRLSDTVEEVRDMRLRQASVAIPPLLWGVIAAMFLLVLGLGGFFPTSLMHNVMLSCIAAVPGVLIALLFILDHPFMGNTSVQPDTIARVVADLSGKP